MTGKRRLAAWLAVFALVFQAALPLSLFAQAQAADGMSVGLSSFCGSGPGSDFGSGGGESGHDDPSCPICRVLCNALSQPGGFLPPATGVAFVPKSPVAAGGVPADTIFPAVLVFSFNCARAPPFPV